MEGVFDHIWLHIPHHGGLGLCCCGARGQKGPFKQQPFLRLSSLNDDDDGDDDGDDDDDDDDDDDGDDDDDDDGDDDDDDDDGCLQMEFVPCSMF